MFFTIILALAGCARFQPKPISPAQNAAELEGRSLTNTALKIFLEKNIPGFRDWPVARWDFDLLTCAAFYYHPDLAVARAQWQVGQAGIKTAGGRPNPTLSLVPGYDTTHSSLSPWFPAVSFDVPMETAGKRGHRIAAAEHLSEFARLNLVTVAWQVRSRLRSSLLDFTTATQRETLLREQVSLQEQIVKLLDRQVQAGAIAGREAAASHITLQKLRLNFAETQSQSVEARVRLAEAIGVPVQALEGPVLSFDRPPDSVPPADLTSAAARRLALQSRSDILGALAEYAAAEATLQLEIAKQYPDVHFSPGYQYDQGDNKWSLGLTFDLPVLNQNQGPVAEAKARRAELAARFNALQAKVLGEIERAVEIFRVNEFNATAWQSLAEAQAKQRDAVAAQFKAGAAEQLDLLNAKMEFTASEMLRLEGRFKFQQACGALEDAVQRPLDLPKTVFQSELSTRDAK